MRERDDVTFADPHRPTPNGNPGAAVAPGPDEEHPAPQSEGKEEAAGPITVCCSFGRYFFCAPASGAFVLPVTPEFCFFLLSPVQGFFHLLLSSFPSTARFRGRGWGWVLGFGGWGFGLRRASPLPALEGNSGEVAWPGGGGTAGPGGGGGRLGQVGAGVTTMGTAAARAAGRCRRDPSQPRRGSGSSGQRRGSRLKKACATLRYIRFPILFLC